MIMMPYGCHWPRRRSQGMRTSGTPQAGTIGRHVLDNLMPARWLRVSPRAVKRPLSRYAYKSLRVDRRTYKATICIDIFDDPDQPLTTRPWPKGPGHDYRHSSCTPQGEYSDHYNIHRPHRTLQ
jgi:hypothetical protein